ncbi:MAG: choice-of-anchor Q domain-containing protein [Verrucomicrobiota bacterium]|jgi:hypothetical protein
MKSTLPLAAACSVLLVYTAPAITTHYVDAGGTNPVVPYTSWATAATNIQDAMSTTGAGDLVLVTNGIYQYGGDSFSGSNRVHVINEATLQSVNGPAVTFIMGYQVPGTTNGPSAVRCVYLTEFSSLSGFTLTNGASGSGYGGGVISETFCVISNCVITGNASAGNGAGSESFNNSLLVNCVLSGNIAMSGGSGGGAYGSTLVNCIVSNNVAANGGGIGNCTVYDSLLTGNGSTNNVTGSDGGAAYLSTLYNCTLAGNFSRILGAADDCNLNNSIIYYNVNGIYADCYMCRLTNCCTTLGLGNPTVPNNSISNAPGFVNPDAGDFHLTPWSRCIDAGNNAVATNSTDLDGNPRIVGAAVDMGAYENQSPFSGTAHYVSLTSTNPVAPYTNWPTAATNLQDAVASAQAGEFVIAGDGVYMNSGAVVYGAETNRVALTNAITLVSSGGPRAAVIAGGSQTRCVYVGTNAVLMGFTLTNGNGSGVIGGDITNEQSGGGAWCAPGGVVSNCIVVGDNAGPSYGFGGGVFGGTIYNSMLTNNNAAYGGGAAMAVLYNSTVVNNSWHAGGHFGGGLYQSTASNCVITANWSYYGAGGVYRSTLYNCTISTNSSTGGPGGGAYQSTLFNCLVISNTAASSGGGAYQSALNYCIVSHNHGNSGGAYQSTNYFCTLSENSGSDGGGANAGMSSNCIFTANSSGNGGGALSGILYNCLLYGNTATNGGGAENATLYNCTVCSNTAAISSGGTFGCSHYNTIVYYNVAPASSNWSGGSFSYCCTVPAAPDVDSFTNPPVFVNPATGDYHQQTNSPTINGGINLAPTAPIILTDLDGNPRIVGGIEDMGAYEFQGSNLGLPIPIPWLRRYGLPLDGSADYIDSDDDGMNNWQEWIAGTDPLDPTSVLKLTSIVPNGVSGTTVTWESVSGITYYLQRGTDLGAQPAFTTIQTNITGQPITTSYTDTTANNGDSVFYRVGVQ